ncbi:pentapeptide repeat-containing protein [Kineosporia mesophila]|nr:pentapeptide repeat-containing protein [Kineosporia mesophila]MCD5353715.1 pentapeptide repeat-containing protein [Kineosporia mesophila]
MLVRAAYGQTLRRISFDDLQLLPLRLPDVLFLERCSFVGTDLRQATLDGGHFKMCNLRGADLRGASLRNATFSACDLRGADLRGTDLTRVRLGRVLTGSDNGHTLVSGAVTDRGVDLTTFLESDQK